MRIRWTPVIALTVAALGLAACAPTDQGSTPPATTAPAPDATTPDATTPAPATTTAMPTGAALATVTPGKLTIATSEPAYEPWMVNDDPTNGQGYESAVAYAVAAKLGFTKDQVVWVRQTFDQLIAPGAKNFDFAINQVSITDDRKASVDFSSSYYDTSQAVVTLKGGKADGATSIADLKDLKIGAMVGTTSLTVAQNEINPSTPIQVFNDDDQLTQALTAGLVDAIVDDLPTALYVADAELDNGVIVGQLPNSSAGGDQFGLVLDKGSALTPAVTAAVDALRADGTLATLQTQWLTDSAGAPVLQ